MHSVCILDFRWSHTGEHKMTRIKPKDVKQAGVLFEKERMCPQVASSGYVLAERAIGNPLG